MKNEYIVTQTDKIYEDQYGRNIVYLVDDIGSIIYINVSGLSYDILKNNNCVMSLNRVNKILKKNRNFTPHEIEFYLNSLLVKEIIE